MAGREIEDPPFADRPAESHARWFGLAIGLGVEAFQRHGFWGWHYKRFAVALDFGKLEVFHPAADRVIRIFHHDLRRRAVINVFSPTARGAQQPLEWFGK